MNPKQERRAFDEMDRNCNTCARLTRVARPKEKARFLYGKCDSTEPHLYTKKDGVIMFHPNDHMGMECWEHRDDKNI